MDWLLQKEDAIKPYELMYDDNYKARRLVNNPTGENVLQYAVVQIVNTNYKHVVLSSGLGENQITHYTRLDSYYKGYEAGTPDIELKHKVGGYTDVLASVLKSKWIT